MQHTYEVRFHTGDSWGRGCASSVSFEVYGSQYNLTSEACVQQEIPPVAAKRSRAVQFAASKGRSGKRVNGEAGQGPPPPLEKRNVFALFSKWLESSGGAAVVKQLVRAADDGGDGVLAMEEVRQLLAQAVPAVSELEAQLFVSMVDVNGDGLVSEQELLQSVGDCAGIDAAVSAGGSLPGAPAAPPADPVAAPAPTEGGSSSSSRPLGTAPSPATGSAGADMVAALEASVRHLRSNAAAVDAKLVQLNPPGGYLTYAQLNELFQAVVPESLGGRAALRALLAHVARTANISPLDPGVHLLEFKRCFGLQAAAVGDSGGGSGSSTAAVAAGWVPGRPRDIFRLLRYHVKHNRAQLEELFPRGTELTTNQVRHLVRQLLDTRVGEPPLTGREARHLVAALDANANGCLSREEFDGGLRECRDISAALSRVHAGRGLADPAALGLQLDALMFGAAPAAAAPAGDGGDSGGGEEAEAPAGDATSPTWASFLGALAQLHGAFVGRSEEAEAAWRRNDSRGKGRIDACELLKVILEVAPGLLSPPLLRAVLIYLDGWDPSEHSLLSRKHFLAALRCEPPPDSLQPPAVVPLATAGEGVTAAAPPLLGISQGLTRALYGGNVDAGGLPGLLPDPAQWREWHRNIRTRERPSGAVALGGSQPPARPGFWRAQWRWHTAWLAANTGYRQQVAAEAATAAAAAGTGAAPPQISGVDPVPAAVPAPDGAEPNCLEFRAWPPVSVAALPCLSAVFAGEVAAWRKAQLAEQHQHQQPDLAVGPAHPPLGGDGQQQRPAAFPAAAATATATAGGPQQRQAPAGPGPVAEAVDGDGPDAAAALRPSSAAPSAEDADAPPPPLLMMTTTAEARLAEAAGVAAAGGDGVPVPPPGAEAEAPLEAAADGGQPDIGQSAASAAVAVSAAAVKPTEQAKQQLIATPATTQQQQQQQQLGGGEGVAEDLSAAASTAAFGVPAAPPAQPEFQPDVAMRAPQPAAAAGEAATAAAPFAPRPLSITVPAESDEAAAAVVTAAAVVELSEEARGLLSSAAAAVSSAAASAEQAEQLPAEGARKGDQGPNPDPDPTPSATPVAVVDKAGAPARRGDAPRARAGAGTPLFQAPPLLAPCRLVGYQAVLAAGAQLGNVDSLSVRGVSGAEAWYLDRVEVRCPTAQPQPLSWEVTVRRWLQPGERLEGLRTDPCAWEEWEVAERQAGDVTGKPGDVLYFNRNTQQCVWGPPRGSPLPALPGAIPQPLLADPRVTSPSAASAAPRPLLGGVLEWERLLLLQGAVPPLGLQRGNVRFLDTLRSPPAFRTTRVRPGYEIGFGGMLGVVPGQEVRVRGQRCSRSIAVQARGGFKAVDPDDPSAARLMLPAGGGGSGGAGGVKYGGAGAAAAAAAADGALFGSCGVFPGVRECVVLSYGLEAAAGELREKYCWLVGYVALDDSSGTPPAPLRFVVVRDGALAWAAWVRAAGEVHRCCVPVLGCRQLHLVVESDFSGGARAVWLDPGLVCAPVHDKALGSALERAARENQVAASGPGGELKVSFVGEAAGAISYMAPAGSVPAEVSRVASSASYRITVFSGPERNGGTRGRVFIRLHGRRGSGTDSVPVKSNLVCLNPDGAALKEGDKHSLLEPLSLPSMDEVEGVVLQHVPHPAGLMGGGGAAGGPTDWSVQHVEVTCDETGRTWYFVAGCWFLDMAGRQAAERAAAAAGGPRGSAPGKLPPAQMEVALPRVTSETQLKVVFHIISSGKGVGMGIEGDLQMVLVGMSAGGYQYAPLTLPGSSIDRPHEARILSSPVPLGELQTVELSCRQQGLLATRLQYIEVVRLSDGRHYLFLPPSPDPAEPPHPHPHPDTDPAATRLVLRAASQPYFRIATFTSDLPEASTDARVYVDLFGSRGKLLDVHLRDSTGDCFNSGAEDVFFFPDPGLGELGSICISHDDSGDSPNWHLDRVEVSHTGSSGRTSVFVCKQWIGLRAHEQGDGGGGGGGRGVVGRFGDDRVLERVLYPTHVLAALKDGKPLLRYHLLFICDSPTPTGQLVGHTAEALQLVGRQAADGSYQFSDVIILEGGRTDMDLELDLQYVRHVQAASRAEAQRGLEDVDAPPPPPPDTTNGAPGAPALTPVRTSPGRLYRVVLRKLDVFQPRANMSAGLLGPRQMALVLHGSADSCRPIVLGADNCTTGGVAPFTSTTDDVFQVTCDTALGPQLLRADVRLPGTAPPDWGVRLQSVTVQELSDEGGEPTEFLAGAQGRWVGASPDTPEGVAGGGTQALHMLPAGCCAVSFVARALQEVAALHVRHDAPGLRPGWALRRIELLVSPPAGAPARGAGGGGGGGTAAAAGAVAEAIVSPPTGAAQQQQAALAVSPRLYRFPGSEEQRRQCKGGPTCWPSEEAPFIRHFLTDEYLAQPYPHRSYFRPPLIAAPQVRDVPPAGPEAEAEAETEASGGDLAPVDTAATAALLRNRDPERLQALAEEYAAEVAAYLEQSGPGGGAGTDLFTLMRARVRAEPNLLPNAFTSLDTDKDGKLTTQQVSELAPRLLPAEVGCSPQQSAYAAAMLTLGSEDPMTQPQVVAALKACRSAYKEAASMVRMVEEGGVDWYQLIQEDGLGADMALCRLAEQLVQPANAAGAVEAFRQYDTDGSGYLDIGELSKALQSIPDVRLSSREVRLLLAYLFHFGDKDRDLRLSVLELQTSLSPFVPRPPAEELARAVDTYHLSRNLPALLRVVNKLQPALLPAACAQAKAAAAAAGTAAAAAAPGTDGAPAVSAGAAAVAATGVGEDVSWVPLSLLADIIAAAVPGVHVPGEEVAQLHQLIALDSGATGLSVKELVSGILLSADAVKRAASIARMVSLAREEREPLSLDRDLQSAEAVLQRLSDVLAEAGGEQIAAAFAALDRDGSRHLDGPELCAAVRQVEALVTKEELRTLLAYVQKYADKDANGRVSLEELQVLLEPFR